MDEAPAITPKEFSEATGVGSAFASLVLAGKRKMPRRLAIKVYRSTGKKLGPIADATDAEIAVLEKFEGEPDSQGAAA